MNRYHTGRVSLSARKSADACGFLSRVKSCIACSTSAGASEASGACSAAKDTQRIGAARGLGLRSCPRGESASQHEQPNGRARA
eukprot:6199335-Pleurochrysis_carterae.AAC.3